MPRVLLSARPEAPDVLPQLAAPLKYNLTGPIWIVVIFDGRYEQDLDPRRMPTEAVARLAENGWDWNPVLVRWWKYA